MSRTGVNAVITDGSENILLGPQTAAASIPVVLASGSAASASTGLLFVSIAVSGSGDNTLVALNATKKIKVVSYTLVASGVVSAKFKSGAGTDLTGPMAFAANGGVANAGITSAHLLETAINSALILNLSGAVAVAGHLAYFLEA